MPDPKDLLSRLNPEVQEILSRYEEKRAAVLPLLRLGQERVGSLTPEVEAWVSHWTGVPPVHIREVVTFYSMFHEKPQGRYHIRFCTSLPCVLMGCDRLLEYLKKKLGIQNGKTSPDGRFSLEEAECLCACEMAPMMQVNGPYYGPLSEEKIDEILDLLKST